MFLVYEGRVMFSADQIMFASHAKANFNEVLERCHDGAVFIQSRKTGQVEAALVGIEELDEIVSELERLNGELARLRGAADGGGPNVYGTVD